MNITKDQRLVLINQNRILALLDPSDAADHDFAAEAFRHGLEDHLLGFDWVYDAIDPRVVQEVDDILEMFEVLERSVSKVGGFSKQEEYRLKFAGFDGNADHPQYLWVTESVKRPGYWSYLKGRSLNSHAPVLGRYRRMLAVFKPKWSEHLRSTNFDFDRAELEEFSPWRSCGLSDRGKKLAW